MNTFFISYVLSMFLTYGVLSSVSLSYYKLPRNLQFLFTIAMWGYAIPAIMIGVPLSGLMFLAGSGICFVGAAPAFKDLKMENTVHSIGAIVGIFFSQIFITFIMNQWYLTAGLLLLTAITYLIPKMKPNIVWWIEIFTFLTVSISYFLLIF